MYRTISFGTGKHKVELIVDNEMKAYLEIEGDNEQDIARSDEIDLDDMEDALGEFVAFIKQIKARQPQG